MANLGGVFGLRLSVDGGCRQRQAYLDAGPRALIGPAVHRVKAQAAAPALDGRPSEEQADAQARGRIQGLAPGEGVQGRRGHAPAIVLDIHDQPVSLGLRPHLDQAGPGLAGIVEQVGQGLFQGDVSGQRVIVQVRTRIPCHCQGGMSALPNLEQAPQPVSRRLGWRLTGLGLSLSRSGRQLAQGVLAAPNLGLHRLDVRDLRRGQAAVVQQVIGQDVEAGQGGAQLMGGPGGLAAQGDQPIVADRLLAGDGQFPVAAADTAGELQGVAG